MKLVEVWQTEDGGLFHDRLEAASHEAKTYVDGLLGKGQGQIALDDLDDILTRLQQVKAAQAVNQSQEPQAPSVPLKRLGIFSVPKYLKEHDPQFVEKLLAGFDRVRLDAARSNEMNDVYLGEHGSFAPVAAEVKSAPAYVWNWVGTNAFVWLPWFGKDRTERRGEVFVPTKEIIEGTPEALSIVRRLNNLLKFEIKGGQVHIVAISPDFDLVAIRDGVTRYESKRGSETLKAAA